MISAPRAFGQAADPFQSAPGPATATPKPTPQARPAQPHEHTIIERVYVPQQAPRPAPEPQPTSLPPSATSQSVETIRQLATARGQPLPGDLRIIRPAADVPAEFARFSGAWGGDYRWNDNGRQPVVIVESIDRNGIATVVCSYGPPNPTTYNQSPAKWWRASGRIEGRTLTFEYGSGWIMKLTIQDDQRVFAFIPPKPEANPPFRGSQVWLVRIS